MPSGAVAPCLHGRCGEADATEHLAAGGPGLGRRAAGPGAERPDAPPSAARREPGPESLARGAHSENARQLVRRALDGRRRGRPGVTGCDPICASTDMARYTMPVESLRPEAVVRPRRLMNRRRVEPLPRRCGTYGACAATPSLLPMRGALTDGAGERWSAVSGRSIHRSGSRHTGLDIKNSGPVWGGHAVFTPIPESRRPSPVAGAAIVR
jgi:hypothetical protein